MALEYDEDEIGDLSDHGSDLEGDTAPEELAPQLAFLLTIDERDKAARLRGVSGFWEPGGRNAGRGRES